MNEQEDLYQCVGVCMSDPDSGYCMGCGRPPMGSPDVAIEIVCPPVTGEKPIAETDNPA
jgi:hypothetical protein